MAAVEPAGLVLGPRADVDADLRTVRHHVADAPPVDHVRAHCRSLGQILELEHLEDLVGRLDDGVDAELGFDALVRGTAVDGNDVLAGPLASQLEAALEVGRFEHEHDVGPSGGFLDEGPGAGRPDLLVRVEESLDGGVGETVMLQKPQEPDDEEQAPLHVVHPRPERTPLIDAPEIRPGADRPHRVEMPEQQHPDAGPLTHDPQQRSVVGQHRTFDTRRVTRPSPSRSPRHDPAAGGCRWASRWR